MHVIDVYILLVVLIAVVFALVFFVRKSKANERLVADYKARFSAVFNTEDECNALKSSLENELAALKNTSQQELSALD